MNAQDQPLWTGKFCSGRKQWFNRIFPPAVFRDKERKKFQCNQHWNTCHQSVTQFCAHHDFMTSILCSFGPKPVLKSYRQKKRFSLFFFGGGGKWPHNNIHSFEFRTPKLEFYQRGELQLKLLSDILSPIASPRRHILQDTEHTAGRRNCTKDFGCESVFTSACFLKFLNSSESFPYRGSIDSKNFSKVSFKCGTGRKGSDFWQLYRLGL